jgi:hypothetical protein
MTAAAMYASCNAAATTTAVAIRVYKAMVVILEYQLASVLAKQRIVSLITSMYDSEAVWVQSDRSLCRATWCVGLAGP